MIYVSVKNDLFPKSVVNILVLMKIKNLVRHKFLLLSCLISRYIFLVGKYSKKLFETFLFNMYVKISLNLKTRIHIFKNCIISNRENLGIIFRKNLKNKILSLPSFAIVC